MFDLIPAIIITLLCLAVIFLAIKWDYAATKVRIAEGRITWLNGQIDKLESYLSETNVALQTALGGGWQLASPDRDVFLLPEMAVREFSDTLFGGIKEQYRRAASVTIFMDDDLFMRVINADRLGVPIAFRGLEWRVAEIGHPQGNYGLSESLETRLTLVTYAAR